MGFLGKFVSVPTALFACVFAQILLLVGIVYLPAPEWFDREAISSSGQRLAAFASAGAAQFYFGKTSLEYARALKSMVKCDPQRTDVEDILKEALQIEWNQYSSGNSVATQRYLDGIEVVDTSTILASDLLRKGKNREAESILSRAFEVITSDDLHFMTDTENLYAKALEADGRRDEAAAVRDAANEWKKDIASRYNQFVARLALVPQQNRRGMALFYFANYASVMAKQMLLFDRLNEAERYGLQCVETSARFPDYPHRPTDLAALGLIYEEGHKYQEAQRVYDQCLQLLSSVSAPDVLYLLPQYQSMAEVLNHLKKGDESKQWRLRAKDSFMFLFELRDKYSMPASLEDFRPGVGSLVKVAKDGQLHSARITQVDADGCYCAHLIGSPAGMDADVIVKRAAIFPHPPYMASFDWKYE